MLFTLVINCYFNNQTFIWKKRLKTTPTSLGSTQKLVKLNNNQAHRTIENLIKPINSKMSTYLSNWIETTITFLQVKSNGCEV